MSYRVHYAYFLSAFLCLVGLLAFSCSYDQANGSVGDQVFDSVAATTGTKQAQIDSLNTQIPRIGYHKLVISTKRILDSIQRTYAKAEPTFDMYRIVTLLNRKDLRYIRLGDTIVLPDSNVKDVRAYSIFPQYWAAADTIQKIMVVSVKYQAYACYENGKLVRFAATNSGEERKPSLPGRYAANWKQRLRISSLNSSWRLPFTVNIHQQAGTAFHQFDMPGRPVSHSCFRQLMHDAQWLYEWIRVAQRDTAKHRLVPFSGTPVFVLDVFDFTRRRGGPWLDATSNQDVTIDLPADPMGMEEALIPISQIPHGSRGSLRNVQRYLTADSVLKERGVIRKGVTLRESVNYNWIRAKRKAAMNAGGAAGQQSPGN